MKHQNVNNFSLDHNYNYNILTKKKLIEKNDDNIFENRRNKFISSKLEVDNIKKKFIFDNIPRSPNKKPTLGQLPFFQKLKNSNRKSNFQHTSDFVEHIYKPFLKEKIESALEKSSSPLIKKPTLKFGFLESSEPTNTKLKLPKINLRKKILKNSHAKSLSKIDKLSDNYETKSPNGERDPFFLTNNYENLKLLPSTELRDDLMASIQKIERMLKTPLRRDRRKKLFQSIYNQDEFYLKTVKQHKKEKTNCSLLDYQNNLMNIISPRMSDESLRSLSINLKKIREKNETVQPLKINWEEYNKMITNLNKLKKQK